MNLTEKKSYLKSQLGAYLEEKHNINLRKNFNCLNPDHDDKNPSMAYNAKENNVHCFSCGVTYDIFNLIELDYGITDFMGQVDQACNIFGLETHKKKNKDSKEFKKEIENKKPIKANDDFNFKSYFENVRENIRDCKYLEDRGISKELISKYGIGYDSNFTISTGGQVWQAVIIPTSETSFIARNINANTTDTKNKVRAKGKRNPFNINVLEEKSDRPIFIVEGEIDALSILEVGGLAIGLGGDTNQNRLIEGIENSDNKAPLIIAFDNDQSGKEQGQNLLNKLKERDIKAYILDPFATYNDPNDYLLADKEEFSESIKETEALALSLFNKEIERAKADYINSFSTSSYIADFFNGIAESVNTASISTGFTKLDDILDGGIYSGLYIVGAISSLGKTTFVMQIADQVAQQGQDVLIYSLEMGRYELMAKSISRQTILIANQEKISSKLAKTTRGITTAGKYKYYSDDEKELIKKATIAYSRYAKNIFITEGIGDIGVQEIKENVKRHIAITGNRPLVIIDYLQILAPADMRATDKQNTDKAVLELKRLSRDFNLPVLAISSLNRESYSKGITMSAFKESGAIEYGSDVLIGLQIANLGEKRNEDTTEKAKAKEKREIQVKILKNRNGKTGTETDFDYYTLFNYFREKEN